MPRQILVCGFHRSGTSMTMQALVRAGLYPGDALIGADPSNPDGHFEDIETVRLHDRWLAAADSDWCHARTPPAVDEDEADARIGAIAARLDAGAGATAEDRAWGLKDPRATLFLPHWLRALPELHLVMVYRHYASCLDSLQRRQASELLQRPSLEDPDLRFWTRPDSALGSWLEHNRCVLEVRASFPERCLVVSQEALVGGAPPIEHVERRWRLGLDARANTGVDAGKTRQARTIDLPDTELREPLESAWQALEAASEAPAGAAPTVRWRAPDAGSGSDASPAESLAPLWERLGVAA